jgi:oligopeptide transport system substrate-binding protein
VNVLDLFCPTCGAANEPGRTVCFACNKPLNGEAEADDTQYLIPAPGVLLHNRYRIDLEIGRGGFATVYRAQDTQQQRMVAIKVISLKTLSAQEMIDATDTYNREIQFGNTLKHSALPELYDHFMDREHWYIVAEFINGETLEDYMQRLPTHRLSLREVLEIGVQICEVLTYLHSLKPPIIFRDIKPDNIMRALNGRLYLVDFGIARHYRHGKQRDTQALGSPGYAAPEQYGTAQTSERSDIYSLGATLRALLTGVNPLDVATETADEMVLASVPTGLTALLDRMLEKDPQQRPTSAEEIHQQLALIAEEEGIPLPGTRPPSSRKTTTSIIQPIHTPAPASSYYPVPPTPTPRRISLREISIIAASLVVVIGLITGTITTIASHSSPPATTVISADQNTLTLSQGSDGLTTLDPAQASTQTEKQVATMLFAGLTQLDKNLQPRPSLASSWYRNDGDGLTWTFKLRPDLTFGDGSPLTAKDVIYSIDRALDPAVLSPLAVYYLWPIANADQRLAGTINTLIGSSLIASDDRTVQIKTSKPISFLPYSLTCSCAGVIPRDQIQDNDGEQLAKQPGAASGPFKFLDQDAEKLDLVPNTYYSGEKPSISKVSFLNSSDYDSGKVLVNEVSSWSISTHQGQPDFHQQPYLEIVYYAMNYLTKPFDNIKIRQAFALALDKQHLMSGLGGGIVPTNHLIPEGQNGYNEDLTGPAGVKSTNGDLTLAKRLLQEGMKEEGISDIAHFPSVKFTYAAGNTNTTNEIKSAIQMWKQALGITVATNELSWTDFSSQQAQNQKSEQGFQLWRGAWIADYPDPEDWTTLQFGKGSPYNDVSYGQNKSADAPNQQQVQQLLEQADKHPDTNAGEHAARMKFYQQAEQELVNDVAWLPLYQYRTSYQVNTRVHNYSPNTLGLIPPDGWAAINLTATSNNP